MVRPKKSEQKDIRQLVLVKSRNLFLKYGFGNITMRRIAEDIGASPGAIYLYFKNKEAILAELRKEGFALLDRAQQTVMDAHYADPMDKLIDMGKTYIQFGLTHREYYDIMFLMNCREHSADPVPGIRSGEALAGLRSFQKFRRVVDECKNAGSFSLADADTVAFFCHSYAHGQVSLIIRQRTPVAVEKETILIDECMAFFSQMARGK